MKILHDRLDAITRNSICAIGGFDGVHRGHQAIVKFVKGLADQKNHSGIITFIPIPFFVLKGKPEICLTSIKEKEAVFDGLGIDFIYYFKFTRSFSCSAPDQFVDRIVKRIKPMAIVVGADFHFGVGRKGSITTLKGLAAGRFSVYAVPPVKDGEVISSTRIRELLLLGNIRAANKLLGREYEIHGRVVKGKGRGQRLGFPTINVKVAKGKLIPLDGVYAVRVFIDDRQYRGAMFCHQRIIEVHILNFNDVLYEQFVKIIIQQRIRAIKHFDNDEDLSRAIAQDIQIVRGNR